MNVEHIEAEALEATDAGRWSDALLLWAEVIAGLKVAERLKPAAERPALALRRMYAAGKAAECADRERDEADHAAHPGRVTQREGRA